MGQHHVRRVVPELSPEVGHCSREPAEPIARARSQHRVDADRATHLPSGNKSYEATADANDLERIHEVAGHSLGAALMGR
jgi:hypothetical protein